MRTRRLTLTLLSITVAISCSSAQDLPFDSPEAIANAFRDSDVVVVGTFQKLISLPWFDGWHRFASIRVEGVIHGPVGVGDELHHRWIEMYGGGCTCAYFTPQYDRVRAIWFLKKSSSYWDLSGPGWCLGPLPLDKRPTVERIARSLR